MESYHGKHYPQQPNKNIMYDYMYKIVVFVFWIIIILHLPRPSECHNQIQHEERRGGESPAFQYTKGANLGHEDSTSFMQELQNFWNNIYLGLSNNLLSFAKKTEGPTSVWTQALGSTILISTIPFLILYFVPLDSSEGKQCMLKILLGFASGGLLGDSFLHLIPHSLGTHHHHGHHHHHHHHGHKHRPHQNNNHHHHHHHHDDGPHPRDAPRSQILTHIQEDQKHLNQTAEDIAQAHSSVGFYVLLGIVMFLVIEKSVRLVNKGHSHSHNSGVSNKKKDGSHKDSADGKKGGNAAKKGSQKDKEDSLTVAGYLNLAADFAHNFTDGLAIGASYLAGKNIGFITTFTILLHEIPHEIGDFAILIQSGCSRKKAMGLQLVTALGAVLGTLIALWTEGGDITSSWILPFTAGGFIYISTVSILPELLEDSGFFQSLKEILALIIGVLLMIFIADME